MERGIKIRRISTGYIYEVMNENKGNIILGYESNQFKAKRVKGGEIIKGANEEIFNHEDEGKVWVRVTR